MQITIKIILLFWAFNISLPLVAQTSSTLKGTIKDPEGKGISGALITIPDLKTSARTDTSGSYQLMQLPKGTFMVQCSAAGFTTESNPISLNGETVYHAVLSENIIERNEVVVTGTSVGTERRKSPAPIQTISLKELQENPAATLMEALTTVPGVSQTGTGPSIAKPVIRGLGANRVLVISQGVRQEGQQWGDEHGIEIDDNDVSGVEILKGPASLAYGSDALAGVLNILPFEAIPQGESKGKIVSSYQTNNGLAMLHAQAGSNHSGIIWHASGTLKYAHDYRNAFDGTVFNTRFNNQNFGAAIGIHKPWGYSKLSFTSFRQTLGLAEGDRDSMGHFLQTIRQHDTEAVITAPTNNDYAIAIPMQKINHQKWVWQHSQYFKNQHRLSATLGYQQNTRNEYEDVLTPQHPAIQLLLKTYSYDLQYILPKNRQWNISWGINGMKQDNFNQGSEYLIPDYQLFDIGVFTLLSKQWNDMLLSGGIRYDHRKLQSQQLLDENSEVHFQAIKRNFSNLSGSIGFSYSLPNTVLKVNLASGYRAPNIAELSANGIHEGTFRYEYGNPGLKPERSLQADGGIEFNTAHTHLSASLFVNRMYDYIYLHKLTNAAGDDSIPLLNNEDGYAAFRFHQNQAITYGGEMYMDIHPHPFDWLHVEQGFSWVRGVFLQAPDSMRNIPFMPAPKWHIGLRAQYKNGKSKWQDAYLRISLDNYFAQNYIYNAYHTETPTPGYSLLHAGVGMTLVNKKAVPICTFSFTVQNLLNKSYQDHLSRLKYAPENLATGKQGIYNMGRNAYISLQFPLIFSK